MRIHLFVVVECVLIGFAGVHIKTINVGTHYNTITIHYITVVIINNNSFIEH